MAALQAALLRRGTPLWHAHEWQYGSSIQRGARDFVAASSRLATYLTSAAEPPPGLLPTSDLVQPSDVDPHVLVPITLREHVATFSQPWVGLVPGLVASEGATLRSPRRGELLEELRTCSRGLLDSQVRVQ